MLADLPCRCVIRLAAWFVPTGARSDWQVRWMSCVYSLRVLIGRGEFPRENSTELGWLCGAAAIDAFRTRYGAFDWQKWLRSPVALLTAAYSLLLALAVCTRGFSVSRLLIRSGGERGMPYALVLGFALLVCIAISLHCRARLRGNWRFWAFLLLKTGGLVAILSLLWVEGGFALRRHLPNETIRALGGGLLLAVAYLGATGFAVLWCVGDQQRRCPVCVRLMSAPARIGSWASAFEPVMTGLLCDEGHGALYVQECETGEPDHWLAIDAGYHLSSHEPNRDD